MNKILAIFMWFTIINVSTGEVKNNVNSDKRNQVSEALIKDPKCSEELKRICAKSENDVHNLNNFAVLECIQNQERDESALLSQDCHHVLWNYKYSLTQSPEVEEVVKGVCRDDPNILKVCAAPGNNYGNLVACMIQSLDKFTSEKCHQYIIRLATTVFSDYHLIQHMTENCKNDIEKFKCGRIQTAISTEPHSQGRTIECLSKETESLEPLCQQQIFRLAELQSEDFHLDRAFYFACREDRDKFCQNIRAGKGKVYQCLLKHKNERTMSQDCSEQLSRRETLIAHDYQASRGLVRACKAAIKENQCRKGVGQGELQVKLSKILLCLEDALHQGKILDGDCQQEILVHRQMLLDVSPKIAGSCKTEIVDVCGGFGNSAKLHCLMKLYKKRNKKLSPECRVALEDVVRETDPAEDWRVDPVLYEACLPVVQSRCKSLRGGQGRVMRCLMRQIDTQFMTDNCEAALLEIQYFVARDWKLDPQLYQSCKNDSVKLCFADGDWSNPSPKSGADNSYLVLPCLFRYTYHQTPELRLSHRCASEVRRVMHERAAYVSLHPQIEMTCLDPLAALCSDDTGPGQEMLCLQKNIDKLGGFCLDLVKNYTEAEVKDVGLNSLITTHCSEVMEQICSHELQSEEDEGAVMDCLIRNKNIQLMRDKFKCRAVVENFQIIMLKDFAFTPKFKQECHESVRQHCLQAHSRKDVLDCLAERMLSDILNEDRSSIPKGCKQQIRKQLAQRHESVDLDPTLKDACRNDIKNHCSTVSGPGMVLDCLRNHQNFLDKACHEVVFEREKEESADPTVDVILMRNCREMLKTFCKQSEPEQMIGCLMNEKDNPDFDMKCRHVLIERLIERSKDIRLNPELFKSCKPDMEKYCKAELNINKLIERNGRVIECLKEHLTKKKLTHNCELRVIQITKNSALNYKLDPILVDKCSDEMKVLCNLQSSEGSEKGEMEECLKLQLEQNKIKNEECKQHIAEIMERERADIHADPILFQVCSIDDTKFCSDREQGTHLACLFDVLDRNSGNLERKCREKLRERREMFKAAVKYSKPETFEDLYESVRTSPQRNYLLIILITGLGVIFLGGLTCGRASRRTYQLLKNR